MTDPIIDTIRATPAHLADVYREALDDLAQALAVERARHEQTRSELDAARQERDIAEQVAARAGTSHAQVAELTAERDKARAALAEVQSEAERLLARVTGLEAEVRVSDQRLADQHDRWSRRVRDPVDPEAVARSFTDAPPSGPHWIDCTSEWRRARVGYMRRALTAHDIPVTPEACK